MSHKGFLLLTTLSSSREMIKETAINAGWKIAGEAVNGQNAFEKYQKLKPDSDA